MYFYNKKFLFLLAALNFIGFVSAFVLYIPDLKSYYSTGDYFSSVFFIVSAWLYLFAFIFTLYLYYRKEIPKFLGGLCFLFTFVYGIGSFIFYPLFMLFVDGLTLYHTWNIFAHGFVGLQSFLFLKRIRRPGVFSSVLLAAVFVAKDVADFFYDGFLYFVQHDFPYFFKVFLIALILVLQVVGFYLLLSPKRLK